MKHLLVPVILPFVLAAGGHAAVPGPVAEPAGKTLVEWAFDRDGDLQGWQANGDLAGVTVAGGLLSARAVGSDPILVLGAPLEFAASPWQSVEVRLKADRDGQCELFWSNRSEGRFGGFSQDKTTRFNVRGDGQWRSYRLLPFWHPEGRIVRLRLDLYDGADFALDGLRVIETARSAAAGAADFDFTGGAAAWQAIGEGSLGAGPDGMRVGFAAADGFLLGPAVGIDAEEDNYLSVSLAADHGDHGTILFATGDKPGLHRLSFPITADGREHTYNVDMLGSSEWRGRVVALGFRPSDACGAGARVRWLKVGAEPQGAPQLKVLSFALEEAMPRAGLPGVLTARLTNTGGETAERVECQLTLPSGVELLATVPPKESRMGFDERIAWSWRIEADAPLSGTASLRVSAERAPAVEAAATVAFTARPEVPPADYVPEPKPVRGETEVGVYYFPGWNAWSRWQPIQGFPERKPVLGWYREGDPEVADWQIKWAVEHGITFFAYDWYWSQGARQLEHGLDAFFQARYRQLMKFCLLWANHNPPGSSSQEDCLAVTRYWIENYFRRPEHLMVDGRPVVIIFSTDRFTSDLGSAGVKRAFEAMRGECRRAGLDGLYLIACVGSAGQARVAAEEGYDAVTAYNWPGLGLAAGEKRGAFETLIDGYRRQWEHLRDEASIPQMVPVSGGWDSRPWHGDNQLVRFGRSPELFRRHLLEAKAMLATNKPSPVSNAILIEAWNEWGEGSYIEPHQEFGFGYLDAIREVFTEAPREHIDLAPADVGLGPYELAGEESLRTAWDFAGGDEGWGGTMQMTEVQAAGGCLGGRTSGIDSAFFGPPMQARADEFGSVLVRMKVVPAEGQAAGDSAQLFWRTSRLAESEASSVRFEVSGDGQWHDYRIPVAANRRWRGLITRLRLDPGNRRGVQVELEAIRLCR